MAPVATTVTYSATTMSLPVKQGAVRLNATAPQIPSPPPLPKYPARPQEVVDAAARTKFEFDPIEDALAAFARGEFLVVADDEGRENEGDLIIAGSEVSTEKMAWMIRHTR